SEAPGARPASEPPMVSLFVLHAIVTLEMFALPIVPIPFVTVHVCDGALGCAKTVTAYGVPLTIGVVNAKLPFELRLRLSPALFWRITVPARPLIVPPTVYLFVAQLTTTPVTL